MLITLFNCRMLLSGFLQLWSAGPKWMWEDDTAEMHCGNSEDLTGSHQCAGEAAWISRTSGSREDGGIHATSKQHILMNRSEYHHHNSEPPGSELFITYCVHTVCCKILSVRGTFHQFSTFGPL